MADSIYPQNFVKLLKKCSPTIKETIIRCAYHAPVLPCEKMLNPVITNQGLCYTTNMLGFNSIFNSKIISKDFEIYKRKKITKSWNESDSLYKVTFNDDLDEDEWSLKDGYKNISATFPIKMSDTGRFVFYFVIDQADHTNLCFFRAKSFSIFFHLPNEVPNLFIDENYVKIESTKNFMINAKKITADESLRSYKPDQRRCYFEGEKKFSQVDTTTCMFKSTVTCKTIKLN